MEEAHAEGVTGGDIRTAQLSLFPAALLMNSSNSLQRRWAEAAGCQPGHSSCSIPSGQRWMALQQAGVHPAPLDPHRTPLPSSPLRGNGDSKGLAWGSGSPGLEKRAGLRSGKTQAWERSPKVTVARRGSGEKNQPSSSPEYLAAQRGGEGVRDRPADSTALGFCLVLFF